MCACDTVVVNPASLVMIHKAAISLFDSCNADDLRKYASSLDAWDKAQVSIYKRKAPGLSDMTISNMMAKTTYMTGTEAVEKGFADKLLEDAAPPGHCRQRRRAQFVCARTSVPSYPGDVCPGHNSHGHTRGGGPG